MKNEIDVLLLALKEKDMMGAILATNDLVTKYEETRRLVTSLLSDINEMRTIPTILNDRSDYWIEIDGEIEYVDSSAYIDWPNLIISADALEKEMGIESF